MADHFFLTQKEKYTGEVKRLSGRNNWLSATRVILFIVTLVLFIYFTNEREISAMIISGGTGLAVFLVLISFQNKVKYKLLIFQYLLKINEEEINRASFNFTELDTGERFLTQQHPYAYDLDVFGRHSLFTLVNRSGTEGGKQLTASWLLEASTTDEIALRQQAVKELANQNEWCQKLQAYGRLTKNHSPKDLLEWIALEERPALSITMLAILRLLLPVITLLAIGAYFLFDVAAYVPLLAIVLNGMVLYRIAAPVAEIYTRTRKASSVLQGYLAMFKHITDGNFSSARINHLKEKLSHDNHRAIRGTQSLTRIVERLDTRGNLFYHILNIIFLLDAWHYLSSLTWKKNNQGEIADWLAVVEQYEALVSLAGFTFQHSDYVFPEVSSAPYEFKANNMGHCLIGKDIRVLNNFSMKGKGEVGLITGSNMSGKSTFLRTVGTNAVLALSGAPVCASSMTISPTQVFTSMRTQDSLEENISSFYAELKRLRAMLDTIEEKGRVLFLVDEVLKGTNSVDRNNGAISLIRKLTAREAMGLISTHDVALGELSTELPQVKNYSFNSVIEGDEIRFSYRLNDGICKSFNASKLMENMGIT